MPTDPVTTDRLAEIEALQPERWHWNSRGERYVYITESDLSYLIQAIRSTQEERDTFMRDRAEYKAEAGALQEERDVLREALERISTLKQEEPSALARAWAVEALEPGHFAALLQDQEVER